MASNRNGVRLLSAKEVGVVGKRLEELTEAEEEQSNEATGKQERGWGALQTSAHGLTPKSLGLCGFSFVSNF